VPPDGTNHANYGCAGGVAVITSCLLGFADVNQVVGDGCEVNLSNDPRQLRLGREEGPGERVRALRIGRASAARSCS
jgi:hypothetical protein